MLADSHNLAVVRGPRSRAIEVPIGEGKPRVPRWLETRWLQRVQVLVDATGAACAAVWRLHADRFETVLGAAVDRRVIPGGLPLPLGRGSPLEHVVAVRKRVTTSDVVAEELGLAGVTDAQSWAAFSGSPVQWPDGQVFGVVGCVSSSGPLDERLACALVDEVAVAVEAELSALALDDELRQSVAAQERLAWEHATLQLAARRMLGDLEPEWETRLATLAACLTRLHPGSRPAGLGDGVLDVAQRELARLTDWQRHHFSPTRIEVSAPVSDRREVSLRRLVVEECGRATLSGGRRVSVAVTHRLDVPVLIDPRPLSSLVHQLVRLADELSGGGEIALSADPVDARDGELECALSVVAKLAAGDDARRGGAERHGASWRAAVALALCEEAAALGGGEMMSPVRGEAEVELRAHVRVDLAVAERSTAAAAQPDLRETLRSSSTPAPRGADLTAHVIGPAPEPQPAIRVVVADDDLFARELMRDLLEDFACDVTVVSDGAELLQAVTADVFDVALVDLRMPKMDGIEAVRAVRRREQPGHRVTVFALTGELSPDVLQRCADAGMDGFFAKPVDIEQLRAALATVRAERLREMTAGRTSVVSIDPTQGP